MGAPVRKRLRSSVPEMFAVSTPAGTSSMGMYSSFAGMYVTIWNGTISMLSSSWYLITSSCASYGP